MTTTRDYDINRIYKDLDLSMSIHPLTGNYKTLDGANAVKKAVKNILQMEKWDSPFQPDIAGGIEGLLFEQASPVVITHVQNKLQDLLKKYEPRIEIQNLFITVRDQALIINLVYEIISLEMTVEETISIKRER